MNLKDTAIFLPAAYEAGNTIKLTGAPGIGKTDCIYAFCAEMSRRLGKPFALVTTILSGIDPVDFRGMGVPVKADDGQVDVRFSRPSVWPNKFNTVIFVDGKQLSPAQSRAHIEKHGMPEDGCMFFDEISQADHDIQKVAAQVMLDRRIGEHVLPGGWTVVAAGNRTEDRAGAVKTLSHLQNRMCEIEIQPDYEAWQDWAYVNNIHPLTIGFAKSNAGEVFRTSVPKQPGPYCTPRSLVLCTRNLMALRKPGMSELQLPDDHIAAEVIQGWLGEGVLPKFISHIRLANDLPDVEDVVKKPDTTKVPDRLDARFVMATSLSVHAQNTKKTKPILKYMTRMDLELQTLFVDAVVKRNPQALTINEFSSWVQTNKDLILAANASN